MEGISRRKTRPLINVYGLDSNEDDRQMETLRRLHALSHSTGPGVGTLGPKHFQRARRQTDPPGPCSSMSGARETSDAAWVVWMADGGMWIEKEKKKTTTTPSWEAPQTTKRRTTKTTTTTTQRAALWVHAHTPPSTHPPRPSRGMAQPLGPSNSGQTATPDVPRYEEYLRPTLQD